MMVALEIQEVDLLVQAIHSRQGCMLFRIISGVGIEIEEKTSSTMSIRFLEEIHGATGCFAQRTLRPLQYQSFLLVSVGTVDVMTAPAFAVLHFSPQLAAELH